VHGGGSVLDLNKYFNDVYLYNVDVWGIMSIFYQYLLSPSTKFNMPNNEYKTFTSKVMTILVENLFTNGNKVVDSGKLVGNIRNLNLYLKSIGVRGHLPDIKDRIKSNGINGNILFFKSVEDSIRLRKAHMGNRDVVRRSVKFGGRYKSRTKRRMRKSRIKKY
jgi:alcohol dehydrogenase YqhD (iron-dependent ADH family)